jgi:pyruvate-formate lyase-activating enzyme
MIPGVNLTEEHVRGVLDFIRPYENLVDYELLPYHRYGEANYGFLGKVYELADSSRHHRQRWTICARSSMRRSAAPQVSHEYRSVVERPEPGRLRHE